MTPGTWRAFRAQRDPAMRAIDRKLVRDLSRLQGQVITIGLVIACGVAAYVALRGTHRSLLHARDAYYERYRFPDVFARLERAPDSLRARIEALSGVARAVWVARDPDPALRAGGRALQSARVTGGARIPSATTRAPSSMRSLGCTITC